MAHPLESVALFEGLTAATLERLSRAAPFVVGRVGARDRLGPREGDFVFRQGDASDAVYAVVGGPGRVLIGAPGDQSKRLMVEVLQPGEVFGELGVIEAAPRTADAYAEGPVSLVRIPSVAFLAVLADTARLGGNLAKVLAGRLRRTFTLFQDASFEPLEVRLARQVLYLADRDGRRTERGVRVPGQLRQGDLADLLGATTRSIITILNAWRGRDWVHYDGDKALLVLREPEALRRLVAGPQ